MDAGWNNLPEDCLIGILSRFGIKSLLKYAPLVSKSWYIASLDPSCWQILDFTDTGRPEFFTHHTPNEIVFEFIKSMVDRSHGSATTIVLPYLGDAKMFLAYISEECPNLKSLSIADYNNVDSIGQFIHKWKDLEELKLAHCSSVLANILTQIGIHCKKFVGLSCLYCSIEKKEALAITTGIPNLKHLRVNHCTISKENMKIIIEGSKGLELLDASFCTGFDEGDEDLRALASHLKSFKSKYART